MRNRTADRTWLWMALLLTLVATAWMAINDKDSDQAADLLVKTPGQADANIAGHRTAGIMAPDSRQHYQTGSPQTASQHAESLSSSQAAAPVNDGAWPKPSTKSSHKSPIGPSPHRFIRPWIDSRPRPLFFSSAELVPVSQTQTSSVAEMPALPFIYAGKLFEDGRYTVFLLSGERSLAVRTGDVMEEVWRVKQIRPPTITFSYLPMKTDTQMDIGPPVHTSHARGIATATMTNLPASGKATPFGEFN